LLVAEAAQSQPGCSSSSSSTQQQHAGLCGLVKYKHLF
jgi:hypothetical protein